MSDRLRPARRCDGAGLRIALALAAPLALSSVSGGAQQPPSPAPIGAALQLSDVSCGVPEAAVLEQFALTVQQRVAEQASPGEFPPQALRQRMEGTVILRLAYAANEGQPSIDVARGSGHAVLDAYAIALARRTTLQPPEPLRCRSFDIAFPLRFRLSAVPPPAPK